MSPKYSPKQLLVSRGDPLVCAHTLKQRATREQQRGADI